MNGFTSRPVPRLIHSALVFLLAFMLASCSREARTARALRRADDYLQKGKYEEAKIECANVLQLDPANADAIRDLGIIWIEQGAPLRALPYLLRTSRDHPGDLEAGARVAEAYLALDARSEAANTAAAILGDKADHARALVLLADAARLPGELKQVRERIDRFPNKETASYHLALGSVLMKSGDLENGEKEFREAIQLDPKDPLPHMALASVSILKKQPEEARKHYQTVSSLAPSRSISSISYAEFLLQSGQLPEASRAVKAALNAAPDYLPARRLDAQISFALGERDAAFKQVQEVLRQDPENLEGAILQARFWMASGETGKATELLERLNKRLPKYPTIRFELARCARLSGNLDRAIQILDEVVRTAPDYAQAVLVLNELRLQQGDASVAVPALETFCRARQGFTPANMLLAQGYRALGGYSEAIAIYRGLLEKEGQQPQILATLGLTYREANQPNEAESCFLEAAKQDPAPIAPLAQLVEMDLLKKDYVKASQRIAERVGDRSPSADLLFIKGKVEAAQELWDQAESNLKRATELNPSLGSAYELLIKIYVATGRLKDAGTQAEALCKQFPNDVRALTTAAVISGQLGDIDKAIHAYESLLAKKPDSTIALNNLACIYIEQPEKLDKAAVLVRRAREQKPSDPAIADTFGWVCFKRKDFSQALALLQESSGQLSGNAEAMYHFGMACYAMGLFDKASDALRKAADLPQQFREKSEISWRLALLQSPESYGIDQLTEMVKQHPEDICLRFRLGQKHSDAREYAMAADALESALKVNQEAFPCVIELAMLYAGPLKKPSSAVELMRKGRSLAPDDLGSKLALGKLAYRIGDWSGAYALFQEALRRSKPDASIPLEFGRAAYALGYVAEAKELISRATNYGSPHDREEAKQLLFVMRLEGSPTDPENQNRIREALVQAPDDPIILMVDGRLSRALGKEHEAEASFNRALQILPNSAMIEKELAGIYLADPNKLSIAHETALKAYRSLPDDAVLRTILTETSFRRKDFAYARQLLEGNARKEPLTPRMQYLLGVCCWEMKDFRAATESLRRSLTGELTDSDRADASRILRLCEGEEVSNANGS